MKTVQLKLTSILFVQGMYALFNLTLFSPNKANPNNLDVNSLRFRSATYSWLPYRFRNERFVLWNAQFTGVIFTSVALAENLCENEVDGSYAFSDQCSSEYFTCLSGLQTNKVYFLMTSNFVSCLPLIGDVTLFYRLVAEMTTMFLIRRLDIASL